MVTLTPESVIAVKTKVNGKVTNIQFYNWETLPSKLKWQAALRGFSIAPPQDSPVTYEFDPVGNSVGDVQKFMEKLAREDGVDLNTAVQNAFGKVVSKMIRSDEAHIIKQLEKRLAECKKESAVSRRVQVALRILKGETNFSIRYGKFHQTNTPNKDLLCDYPDGSGYNKERVKCGNPIKRCMGYDRIDVSVSNGYDDIEHCEEHLQKDHWKELSSHKV